MTSPSALAAAIEATTDPAVARILDAALELFEDVGIRKSTIEDIARRAGVDRVTVYRRVGAKDAVARAVVAREAQRVVERVAMTFGSSGSLEDQVAAAFTTLVLSMRDHQLYNRLLRLEPNETLPKVTIEASEMLAMGIHLAVDALLPPEADAAVRADATARTEVIGRVIHSMVITKRAVLDLDTEEKLTEFARRYIAPMVTGLPTA